MTDGSTPATMAERELTITRVFDAPRELVWRAWTEPEQIARWWGPRGFTTPLSTITVEPRPGGAFRMTMVSDEDGSEYPVDAVFREVVEPERLVFAEPGECHDDIEDAESTVTFKETGDGKTEMVLHVTLRTTEEMRDASEAGWSSQFDRLDEALAQG